ncbi:hypothetical protein Ddye_015887 [Dipteronia dyeriana]|uniref:Uncharacterized protein n=1 Tax=Dipteronia dyeriana TaxID=168575 RepID=A0AAD9U6F0_9ROSI|nr:hypothetical protein Ddye_015887 [Dipteronia dyeriana]
MVIGRLSTPDELNMEPSLGSMSKAGRFLIENHASRLSPPDVRNLEYQLGILESVKLRVVAPFERDIFVYSYPGLILKEVDQLVFPEDDASFDHIGASRVVDWGITDAFQALQTQLFLRKDVRSLSKKVSNLSSSNSKLKKEVDKMKSNSEKFERAVKESSEKLARAEEDNV